MRIIEVTEASRRDIYDYLKKMKKIIDHIEEEFEESSIDSRGHKDRYDDYNERRRW